MHQKQTARIMQCESGRFSLTMRFPVSRGHNEVGDQFYAARPATKVQKETSFNAFSGYATRPNISGEEMNAYAAQNFAKAKQHREKKCKSSV